MQNGMAAILFLFLLLAEGAAYLLDKFPSVEFFWWLAITTNRIAGSVLDSAGRMAQSATLVPAFLVFAVLVALASYARKNWLGTAISGHVALGIGVLITSEAMKRASVGHLTVASLDPGFNPAVLTSGTVSLALLTFSMAVLCLGNHIMFFTRRRESNGR